VNLHIADVVRSDLLQIERPELVARFRANVILPAMLGQVVQSRKRLPNVQGLQGIKAHLLAVRFHCAEKCLQRRVIAQMLCSVNCIVVRAGKIAHCKMARTDIAVLMQR